MKNRLQILLVSTLMTGLFLTGIASAQVESAPGGGTVGSDALRQQPGQDAKLERFQDWTVRCEARADQNNGEELCEMIQQVTIEETGETVMEVAVGFVPDRAMPIALFTVPLGIRIPPGLQLRVDQNEAVRIEVELCGPDGCFASMSFDEPMLQQFRAGTGGTVQIRDPRGQSYDLPISMMGFTAALNRIQQ